MTKYYAEDTKIVWNGNEIDAPNRQKFQVELPDSNHVIECFDVHPIFSKLLIIIDSIFCWLLAGY